MIFHKSPKACVIPWNANGILHPVHLQDIWPVVSRTQRRSPVAPPPSARRFPELPDLVGTKQGTRGWENLGRDCWGLRDPKPGCIILVDHPRVGKKEENDITWHHGFGGKLSPELSFGEETEKLVRSGGLKHRSHAEDFPKKNPAPLSVYHLNGFKWSENHAPFSF